MRTRNASRCAGADDAKTEHHSDDFMTQTLKKLKPLTQLINCPICLSQMKDVHIVPECCHRFCGDCVKKSLVMCQNECPICRVHISSKRCLRPDKDYESFLKAVVAITEYCPVPSQPRSLLLDEAQVTKIPSEVQHLEERSECSSGGEIQYSSESDSECSSESDNECSSDVEEAQESCATAVNGRRLGEVSSSPPPSMIHGHDGRTECTDNKKEMTVTVVLGGNLFAEDNEEKPSLLAPAYLKNEIAPKRNPVRLEPQRKKRRFHQRPSPKTRRPRKSFDKWIQHIKEIQREQRISWLSPRLREKDVKLYNWCNMKRNCYRDVIRGKRPRRPLPAKQINALNSIGFDWGISKTLTYQYRKTVDNIDGGTGTKNDMGVVRSHPPGMNGEVEAVRSHRPDRKRIRSNPMRNSVYNFERGLFEENVKEPPLTRRSPRHRKSSTSISARDDGSSTTTVEMTRGGGDPFVSPVRSTRSRVRMNKLEHEQKPTNTNLDMFIESKPDVSAAVSSQYTTPSLRSFTTSDESLHPVNKTVSLDNGDDGKISPLPVVVGKISHSDCPTDNVVNVPEDENENVTQMKIIDSDKNHHLHHVEMGTARATRSFWGLMKNQSHKILQQGKTILGRSDA